MLPSTIFILIIVQLVTSAPIEDDIVVTLPDGLIRGAVYRTKNNVPYYSFQGVPFATPPLGSLRFEAPQPPSPWSDILNATEDGKACISTNHWLYPEAESEDCLYINVYTPSLIPTRKLPVMFWIYGGSFVSGSNAKSYYGPDFLIEEDVIIVIPNYRLAPFGFLSTADNAIRGNAGLKDQNLALKWTFENIALFGGDPEKITIFGESAGAASISHHLLSKKSSGLFRAAIAQSGSSLNYWAIDQDPKSYALLLADALSANEYIKSDTQQLKLFFQSKSAEEIINATLSLPSGLQVWPCLEVDDEEAFLAESPYELLSSGRFNQVPIITGICSEESLMFLVDLDYTKEQAKLYDATPSLLIPFNLHNNITDEDKVINSIQSLYLKNGQTFSSNLSALAEYSSDNGFVRGILKFTELASSNVPVYFYKFSYYGDRVVTPAFIDDAEKVGHASELPYLFNLQGVSDTEDAWDVLTQNRIVRLWTNFAKFLDPTPEKSELLGDLSWPAVSFENLQYLNINSTLRLESNIRETYQRWVDIFESYGKKPFITY